MMAETDPFDLLVKLEECLGQNRCEEAYQLIKHVDHQVEFCGRGLDLIPLVSKYCSRDTTDNNPALEDCCEDILLDLAGKGNAKELLIGFLEQADFCCNDDIKFQSLLRPIQTVLLRLPSKRGQSLKWVLEVLYSYIKKLPKPKVFNFDQEERKLLDLDPTVRRLQLVLSAISVFYRPFVKEASFDESQMPLDSTVHVQREVLTNFLLLNFDHPLSCLDLSKEDSEAGSESRRVADTFVNYIRKLQSNFYALFGFLESTTLHKGKKLCKKDAGDYVDDDPEHDVVSPVSLGTFFYLVLAEGVESDHLPCVYTHAFVLESCLPLVNTLLKRNDECAIHKGLLLASVILKNIQNKELSHKVMDDTNHHRFAQNLINVMIFSDVTGFRQSAVKMLQEYINKFEYQGRSRLLRSLLSSNQHPGVQGYLIQCFKNYLNETLALTPLPTWFVNKNLSSVLHIIIPLPNGVETDLLDQSDRILGALNLIRFLALRDSPKENVTDFWSHVSFIEEELLNPLKKALDISKAHYQLELKQQQEDFKGKKEGVTMTLGNQSFPNMPREQCLQVLHSALNTFDLIDSVLARIVELFDSANSSEDANAL